MLTRRGIAIFVAVWGMTTGCGSGVSGVPDGSSDATVPDAGAGLRWYSTCGYPVCGLPDGGTPGDAGVADAGTCPALGAGCSVQGQTCGTPSAANCGVIEVCDDHDPTLGGCPISSRRFKEDIRYVDDAGLAGLHDDLMRMRLATYRYRAPWADAGATHLGFIIEDQPRSLAVDRLHDRVDLYGYLSLVAGAVQVQEREIEQLRRELDATRRECRSGPPAGPR